jgi:long-chain fatty acid transport protein
MPSSSVESSCPIFKSVAPLGRTLFVLCLGLLISTPGHAGGGYFVLGYGPYAHQTAGTSTAIGFDGFAGASNPAKLSVAIDRVDAGLLIFMPYRRIERTGADNPIYNFSTTSDNGVFFLPELGIARRITDRLSWGIALYGNGGLNTAYRGTTGVAGSGANPTACGQQPGNFLSGCGELGVDLSQVLLAPTLAWRFAPTQSIGIAPLAAYQRLRIYGLQALEPLSSQPDDVTNRGYDQSFGGGLRLGWWGRLAPGLNAGVAYATPVYMQKFRRYQGLLADGGSFDIPENYSIGIGWTPVSRWLLGLDVQRISYHEVSALGNGLQNSLQNPQAKPLGSADGSGFNWRNQINYRLGLEYAVRPTLKLRAGFAYGRRPNDESRDSVSLNLLTPNPIENLTAGFSWMPQGTNGEVNFAYGRYVAASYAGPSAIAGPHAIESTKAFVNTVWLGYSWHL